MSRLKLNPIFLHIPYKEISPNRGDGYRRINTFLKWDNIRFIEFYEKTFIDGSGTHEKMVDVYFNEIVGDTTTVSARFTGVMTFSEGTKTYKQLKAYAAFGV